jgi:hypothetical protein
MKEETIEFESRLSETDFVADADTVTAEEQSATEIIGRVGAPPQLEATPDQFNFWVARHQLVENNQFVSAKSVVGGKDITYFGIVDEVRRASRKRDILEEYDTADGDVSYEPPFKMEGVTYAHVNILRSQPDLLTPPLEQSPVHFGGEAEAGFAYGFTEMANAMPVGLLRNGASKYAGLAKIDLAYLLGENGGHLNVNGIAGVSTKTSFLLTVNKLLLNQAKISRNTHEPFFVAPIILNVKGEDLMFIDRENKNFRSEHEGDWRRLGVRPEPFTDAKFFTPADKNGDPTISGCNAKAFSWSLSDVLMDEALPYLFSDDDRMSENMQSLVRDILAQITKPNDGRTLRDDPDTPRTWGSFLDWVRKNAESNNGGMYTRGTWSAVYRRLFNILDEGKGIFPRDKSQGEPLRVKRSTTSPPQVIDINRLPLALQRFVVASIMRQVVTDRSTGSPKPGLRYLIMLDELNRFAPRDGKDEITRLLERVATEMRSQGVILLGAQQMASQVSTKVIEMSSIRVLGRSGSAELQDKVWQSWEKSARRHASILLPEDKLMMQPTFRQPMFVKVPYPAWAMKREHIKPDTSRKVMI